MICPENERYNAKQVLAHPWLKNASNKPLSEFQFDPKFLFRYMNSNYLKKLSLLFIASRLEENEIKDLKDIFYAFDQDKDGQISLKELQDGFMQLKSSHLNEKEILNLFKSIDVNKNKRIDYTEFLAATISEKIYNLLTDNDQVEQVLSLHKFSLSKIAECYFEQKNYKEAIVYDLKLICLDPKNS